MARDAAHLLRARDEQAAQALADARHSDAYALQIVEGAMTHRHRIQLMQRSHRPLSPQAAARHERAVARHLYPRSAHNLDC